jgi:hypothetical protein
MDQQLPILSALEASDPEIAERIVSRRDALKGGAAASAGVMTALRVGSVPVALAAFASETFGQSRLPSVVINVLNFALLLEHLEAEFYTRGVASGIIPAGDDLNIFQQIRDHENTHVQFLRQQLGAAARPKPEFDFTGGNGSFSGPYTGVFTNYEVFKAVAQAFEDTGVRAYKGQAPALMPYKAVLTAALTIHSVEARHASEVRRLRGMFQDQEPFYQGWINLANTDIPGPAAGAYMGEDNTVHAGVDAATVAPMIARDEVTEAFDEPLTQAEVMALVDGFIV